MSSISDLMIDAARALRVGADEKIVAMALVSDGIPREKVDTIMRWCKLYNQRTQEVLADEADIIEVENGYDYF